MQPKAAPDIGGDFINELEIKLDKARHWRRAAVDNEHRGDFDAAASHSLMSIACSLEVMATGALERMKAAK